MVKEIMSEVFEAEVLQYEGAVVVDFYSTECPPCEALAPKLEDIQSKYPELKIVKIYRQGNKELALSLNVRSSPTLLFYKNGKEVAPMMSGAILKSKLVQTIEETYGFTSSKPNVAPTVEKIDVLIIGAGPAGLSAAIYSSRAKLKTIVLDKGMPGGQVNLTHLVANYPGTEQPINGYLLMHKMNEQAKASGAKIIMAAEINQLNMKKKFALVDETLTIEFKALIIATGSKPRSLGLPGEERLFGKGISYCATCDGAFYEGKKVLVIGGGNSAVEESLFLTKYVSELTIVHQFDTFQANATAVEEAIKNPKIKVLFHHEPRQFIGEEHFESLEVEDLVTHKRIMLSDADGIFVFIGYQAQNEVVEGQLELDQYGYIVVDEDMRTSREGIYAAGDIRNKKYRQITTAVSDGTIAALSAEKYIHSLK
jgi:thioredoxin reductase (NADPH)